VAGQSTTYLYEKDARERLGFRSPIQWGDYFHGHPEYKVHRDDSKCIRCLCCVRQCPYDCTFYDPVRNVIYDIDANCVNCKRCEFMCPTQCIEIREHGSFRRNAHWDAKSTTSIYKQADSGAVILTGLGADEDVKIYWGRILLDASQVTNPSIDPLREPMETRTYLGRKPDRVQPNGSSNGYPQLKCEIPVIFAPMSFGAISYNFQKGLAIAAREMGTYFNTGEGGLNPDFAEFGPHAIVQVASGRFGVSPEYLVNSAACEIKIGQGAKPGIGGHLPGEKVTYQVSRTRMIPQGADAISPAPQHDIYSIEDLRLLIYALKEATEYRKPVSVKIAAVHNVSAIASGIARAGADIIVLDGYRGGTGATPRAIRDNVGIPIELALAQVDERLRAEGIRNQVSLIAAGSVRSAAEVIKAIALGADACYIGTAAMLAVGCTLCQQCHRGHCSWGITTNRGDLLPRLPADMAAERLMNLLKGWKHEMQEMLGLMGLNSIEGLRGNRLKLRGVDLNELELKTLGIQHAGL